MPRQSKYTKEVLTAAAVKSKSVAQTMRRLGLSPYGSMHGYITRLLKRHKVDTSHFTGKGWNKGGVAWQRIPAEEVLVYDRGSNGCKEPRRVLKRAMVESGLSYTCAICVAEATWNGSPLKLQIDHVDGDVLNNRIENVRFLCPNCHSQTENFGAHNRTDFKESKNRSKVSNKKGPKKKPRPRCLGCQSRVKQPGRKYCSTTCWHRTNRRSKRPTKERLRKLIETHPWTKIGRMFGVSDNAVRKWAQSYELI